MKHVDKTLLLPIPLLLFYLYHSTISTVTVTIISHILFIMPTSLIWDFGQYKIYCIQAQKQVAMNALC